LLLPDYSAYNNRLRPGWILMENPRGCVIKGRPTHSEILSSKCFFFNAYFCVILFTTLLIFLLQMR